MDCSTPRVDEREGDILLYIKYVKSCFHYFNYSGGTPNDIDDDSYLILLCLVYCIPICTCRQLRVCIGLDFG